MFINVFFSPYGSALSSSLHSSWSSSRRELRNAPREYSQGRIMPKKSLPERGNDVSGSTGKAVGRFPKCPLPVCRKRAFEGASILFNGPVALDRAKRLQSAGRFTQPCFPSVSPLKRNTGNLRMHGPHYEPISERFPDGAHIRRSCSMPILTVSTTLLSGSIFMDSLFFSSPHSEQVKISYVAAFGFSMPAILMGHRATTARSWGRRIGRPSTYGMFCQLVEAVKNGGVFGKSVVASPRVVGNRQPCIVATLIGIRQAV